MKSLKRSGSKSSSSRPKSSDQRGKVNPDNLYPLFALEQSYPSLSGKTPTPKVNWLFLLFLVLVTQLMGLLLLETGADSARLRSNATFMVPEYDDFCPQLTRLPKTNRHMMEEPSQETKDKISGTDHTLSKAEHTQEEYKASSIVEQHSSNQKHNSHLMASVSVFNMSIFILDWFKFEENQQEVSFSSWPPSLFFALHDTPRTLIEI
jgi:hypothetical protein